MAYDPCTKLWTAIGIGKLGSLATVTVNGGTAIRTLLVGVTELDPRSFTFRHGQPMPRLLGCLARQSKRLCKRVWMVKT